MPYTLDQLAADIRVALKMDDGPVGKQAVCALVSKALRDEAFLAAHLAGGWGKVRKVLYEDPELGFCICVHVYEGEAIGSPHDHGPSWAIYGQATGVTEMTDWRIVTPAASGAPAKVEPARTYTLLPGDAHFYDVGAVHSPCRTGPTKLIRVEGSNLDHIERTRIESV